MILWNYSWHVVYKINQIACIKLIDADFGICLCVYAIYIWIVDWNAFASQTMCMCAAAAAAAAVVSVDIIVDVDVLF